MKLRALTGLEKIELENENKELLAQAEGLRKILSDRLELDRVLIGELEVIKQQHGDARRTDITNVVINADEKDIQFVQPEDVVVVVSKSGSLKKIPAKSYKVQNRNGVGVKNHDDIVMDVIKTNTIDNLMIFTALGKMYKLVVDQVPTGTNASRGVSAHTLVKMEDHDRVVAITSMKRKSDAKFVVSISEQGYIKKTKIEEYASAKKSGIAAVGLKDDDAIADIVFMNEEEMLSKICHILTNNNAYGVVWARHDDRLFLIKKLSRHSPHKNQIKVGKIYSAIYEEYYDKYGFDDVVDQFDVGYDAKSWKCVLEFVEQKFPLNFN